MTRSRLVLLAAVVVAIGAGVASREAMSASSLGNPDAVAVATQKQHHASPASCGQPPAVLGRVALLQQGVTTSAVTNAGASVGSVLMEAQNVPGSHGDTVVVLAGTSDSVPPAAAALFVATGTVNAQSTDPTLMSCNYKLTDRPADVRIIGQVQSAAIAAGLATATELSDDSDIYLVSDDPTRSDRLIVTIYVPGQLVPGSGAGPAVRMRRAILALVSKASGTVTGISSGEW